MAAGPPARTLGPASPLRGDPSRLGRGCGRCEGLSSAGELAGGLGARRGPGTTERWKARVRAGPALLRTWPGGQVRVLRCCTSGSRLKNKATRQFKENKLLVNAFPKCVAEFCVFRIPSCSSV